MILSEIEIEEKYKTCFFISRYFLVKISNGSTDMIVKLVQQLKLVELMDPHIIER